VFLPATVAFGQTAVAGPNFGKSGQFAISGDRLFGLSWESESTNLNGNKITQSFTTFSLFREPATLAASGNSIMESYNIPRLSLDYFVISGLSVGGSFGYFSVGTHIKNVSAGHTAEQDTGSFGGFLFAPRIGYAFMFTDMLGVWPRSGITYVTGKEKNDIGLETSSVNRLAFSLDAPLVISPFPHMGFVVGPALDVGVSGSSKIPNSTATEGPTSVDVSSLNIALNAGLFVYF
jgi:hypothetical protein